MNVFIILGLGALFLGVLWFVILSHNQEEV
jgi:hypothetical protein